MKKSINKSSTTTNTSSSSSSRNVQPIKEISQFGKELDESEKKKLKQNNSQDNLSKTYANMIKNIIKAPQEKGKQERMIVKKQAEEKAKSQESIEETKNGCETTTSQKNLGIVFL